MTITRTALLGVLLALSALAAPSGAAPASDTHDHPEPSTAGRQGQAQGPGEAATPERHDHDSADGGGPEDHDHAHDQGQPREGSGDHDHEAGEGHGPDDGHGHEEHDDHAPGESGGHGETQGATDEHGHEGEHGHADEDHSLRLDEAVLREFGITLRSATSGTLSVTKRLTGEVVYNPDRYAHALPRAAGVARSVAVRIGERVEAGETLAVLDSRELAEARGRYLAAHSREQIAATNYRRESDLWERQVNSERDFLEAKQALSEARVERRLAEHQLHALGLSEKEIGSLPERDETTLTRYEMAAPIDGVVVERHAVPGEVLNQDASQPPFVIADLSTVWVHLTVYPKDLSSIRVGQKVRIRMAGALPAAEGRIDYIAPALEQATRTATARVVLDNPDGLWKPGLFVTAEVAVADDAAAVVVPRGAVQTVEGRDVVFVAHGGSIEPRPVQLGAGDAEHVAIRGGLGPGERYVAENAFSLKAELAKESFGGHSH